MGTIYKITNTVNGKAYIGQTTDPERRIKEHFYPGSRRYHLQNAIAKYGKDVFTVETLFENVPLDDLDRLEKQAIKEHNTLVPNGYNLRDGGHSCYTLSLETRQKMSKKLKGRYVSPETRQKMSKASKSREAARKGWTHTPEVRKRISESLIGNQHTLGHKQSPETIAKKIASTRGKKRSPETRKRMSEAKQNMSDETKQKMARPERPVAETFFNNLPNHLSLAEKRKHLLQQFPEVPVRTIYGWVQKWTTKT